jgi:hypothetical protein
MPRFGHSNNFTDLFASQPEQNDYIAGLLFAGIFLFAIFFAWTLLLLIFKFVGPKRFGFLAGAPFVQASSSSTKRSSCQPRPARITFILATIALIVFSVLFVTNGLTNLRNTVIVVHDSSQVSLLFGEGCWVSPVFKLLDLVVVRLCCCSCDCWIIPTHEQIHNCSFHTHLSNENLSPLPEYK